MGTSAERARVLSTIGNKTSWGDKSVYKFNNLPKRTARVAQSDSDSLRPSADSLSCFIDGKNQQIVTPDTRDVESAALSDNLIKINRKCSLTRTVVQCRENSQKISHLISEFCVFFFDRNFRVESCTAGDRRVQGSAFHLEWLGVVPRTGLLYQGVFGALLLLSGLLVVSPLGPRRPCSRSRRRYPDTKKVHHSPPSWHQTPPTITAIYLFICCTLLSTKSLRGDLSMDLIQLKSIQFYLDPNWNGRRKVSSFYLEPFGRPVSWLGHLLPSIGRQIALQSAVALAREHERTLLTICP